METPWSTADAITLARLVEGVAPLHGAHVALTGGLLYKDGPRKDADLVIYRVRQAERIDLEGLTTSLASLGVTITDDFGFVKKANWFGRPLDLLFPEQCDPTASPPSTEGKY